MLRLLLLAGGLALAGCHNEPKPMSPAAGELPPLPPASGTPIGYLIDNAAVLKLDDAQLGKLKEIDVSLAARNDSIDTQLRALIRPDEQPAEKGQPPPRHNNAPGAQVKVTGDAGKLQEARSANDKEALQRAFAVLEPDQQATARRLLDDRGIASPGSTPKPPVRSADDGDPLE